jgi:hypothetical protein
MKNPLSNLTEPRFRAALVIIVIVLAGVVPVSVHWVLQRNEMHFHWGLQTQYAIEFWSHLDYAAGLLNGNVLPWSNSSERFVINELGYADSELHGISNLDTSHRNSLGRISFAIETLKTDNGTRLIGSMKSSQRILLSTQFESLAHKITSAYWNFLNYTSTSGTNEGPPFWYFGPAPPDENLLQDAVNIALAFELK